MRFEGQRKLPRISTLTIILMLFQIAAAMFALMYDAAYTKQYEYYKSLGNYHLSIEQMSSEQYEALLDMSKSYDYTVHEDSQYQTQVLITLNDESQSAYERFSENVITELDEIDSDEHKIIVTRSQLFAFATMQEIPYMGYLLGDGLLLITGIVIVSLCAYVSHTVTSKYWITVKYGILLMIPSNIAAFLLYVIIQLLNNRQIYISSLTPFAIIICQLVLIITLCAVARFVIVKREKGYFDEVTDHPRLRIILCTVSVLAISVVFVYFFFFFFQEIDLTSGANYFSVGIESEEHGHMEQEIIAQFSDIPGIDYVIGQISYNSYGVDECVIVEADSILDENKSIRDINGKPEATLSKFFLSPTDEQRLALLSKYEYEGDIRSVLKSDNSVIVSNNVSNREKYRLNEGDPISVAVKGNDDQYSVHEFTVGAILTNHPTSDFFEIYLSYEAYETVVGDHVHVSDVYLGSLSELSNEAVTQIEAEIKKIVDNDLSHDYSVINLNNTRAYMCELDDMTIELTIFVLLILAVMVVAASDGISRNNVIYMLVLNVLINSIVLSPIVFMVSNQYPVYKQYSYPIIDVLLNLVLTMIISCLMYFSGKKYPKEE